MKLYYFQMEVMNKTWRKQVGETGNLKKQKWRGMELGKKNNHSPPPLIPRAFQKDQLVNYTP